MDVQVKIECNAKDTNLDFTPSQKCIDDPSYNCSDCSCVISSHSTLLDLSSHLKNVHSCNHVIMDCDEGVVIPIAAIMWADIEKLIQLKCNARCKSQNGDIKPFLTTVCDVHISQSNEKCQMEDQSNYFFDEKTLSNEKGVQNHNGTDQDRRKHSKVHEPEKKFECDICGCMFKAQNYLNGHRKRAHSNMIVGKDNSMIMQKGEVKGSKCAKEELPTDKSADIDDREQYDSDTDTEYFTKTGSSDILDLSNHNDMNESNTKTSSNAIVDVNDPTRVQNNHKDLQTVKTDTLTAIKTFDGSDSAEEDLKMPRRRGKVKKLDVCTVCGKIGNNISIYRHILRKHPEEAERRNWKGKPSKHVPVRVPCEKCGRYFERRDLRRHLKNYHSEKSEQRRQGALKDRDLPCTLCGTVLKNKSTLRSHMATVHVSEQIPCDVCGKKYKNKDYLRQHMYSHNTKKEHECQYCGEMFAVRTSLYHHRIKNHTKTNPTIPCEVCGHMFRSQTDLQRHKAKHTDERPFICEICGNSYKAKEDLRRHMLLHGPPKHNCQYCGKGFHQLSNMRIHYKVHSKEIAAATS
ncbi:zinc finger protein 59-like [Mya arenaria]|uniref:zinc finger protein 59-like n=1 Tax=Mya arenaria TaxID=6604 RepID=UPI0022E387B9|nr:zinc finger protein 59-like [Mya arenaria]XP_052802879.1 zinc finger protein 59-like [Mya arenaria]XP_052802887.1 zinc finger protein 59-like [Mya arenaria]